MSDLANLFDSPPSAAPPIQYAPWSPSASPGPSRQRGSPSGEALFLSPGSAFDTPQARNKRKSPTRDRLPTPPRQPRFDAYRSALQESEPWLDGPPSPPAGSLGPSGQGGYRNEPTQPFMQNGVYDPLAGLGGGFGDGELGDEPAKQKRTMPKIDAERLMGENGFPALMKAAKRFKVHGKGAERQDLTSLLNMYQLWAHGMFPKGDFVYTIGRVEKVCRTRRMESALSGYRDAFNPPPRTPTPPPMSPGRLTPSFEDEDVPNDHRDRETDGPDADEPSDRSSQPLFTPGDEPDYDELLAMEEAERAEEARNGADIPSRKTAPAQDDGPVMLEEEDEWEGLYS